MKSLGSIRPSFSPTGPKQGKKGPKKKRGQLTDQAYLLVDTRFCAAQFLRKTQQFEWLPLFMELDSIFTGKAGTRIPFVFPLLRLFSPTTMPGIGLPATGNGCDLAAPCICELLITLLEIFELACISRKFRLDG